jgi:hypothetical protein
MVMIMRETDKADTKTKPEQEDSLQKVNRTFYILVAATAMFACICLVASMALGALKIVIPGTKSEIRIKESTEQLLSSAGGEVSLGELTVNVPPDVIHDEALLQIGEVNKRSLPQQMPKNVELLSDVYSIEWGQGAQVNTNPVEIIFSFDPDDMEMKSKGEDLAILTYDGTEWLRSPAKVDAASHTASTEVSHFCLKALARYTLSGFSQREVADHTRTDMDVSGRVEYTRGDYVGDRSARTVPAGNLRFSLIDTDGIELYKGWLESDGSFDFTVPAGTDVAIDLDASIRIYAENNQVGRVLDYAPPHGGVWWYASEVNAVGLNSDRMDFFTITIPEEHSGAFNILDAVSRGQAFSPGIKPDPVTVVWPGTGRGRDVETTYHEDLDIIFLSKDPQTAWDEDLVLRMYGEYVHHWLLLDDSSLFCSGSPKGPRKKSSQCRAWTEGFGYFYSAAVRGDEYYEVYENTERIQEEFNLEKDDVAFGPRSAGSVSQILWDMVDTHNDGEKVNVDIGKIVNLMFSYSTSIDSIASFYNFWSMDHAVTQEFCQLFADHEIIDMDDCMDFPDLQDVVEEEAAISSPADERPPQLVYGDGTMGSLDTYQEDLWGFEGEEGDVVTFTVQPLDEGLELDLVLIDENDNFLAFGGGSIRRVSIDKFELPADGLYMINVASLAGEGDYTLSLLLEDPDGSTDVARTATPTPQPQPTTPTPQPTRTGTQTPTHTRTSTPTTTQTPQPIASLTYSPTPTLASGATGGTIRLTVTLPRATGPIARVCIDMPITNWDDVCSPYSDSDGDLIISQDNDEIRAGEQVTIEAPAGVWSIAAWAYTLGGYNLYDSEMVIDMREDTEWVIEKNPRWN